MTYAMPEIRKVAPAARSGKVCATTDGGTGRRLTGAAVWLPDTTTLPTNVDLGPGPRSSYPTGHRAGAQRGCL